METNAEQLPVTCPECGKAWVLHNYAGLGVAHHDRVVLCKECVDSGAWVERMLRERGVPSG